MEIPTIPEHEKEKIFTRMWVGQLTSATGFIVQKLGTDALEEYTDLIADQSVAQLRAMGVKSPVDFAISQAVYCANIFGSDVDVVPEADGSATLDIKECANLRTALEFAEMGMPITKEQFCGGCINGYFKRVAKRLGLKLTAEFTEIGCRMSIK